MLDILSWVAVILLSSSYWFQIWKIHIHKEVRDLSLAYWTFLAIGFCLMIFIAYREDTMIFLVKNILVAVPAFVIIGQILYHQGDHWSDGVVCAACGMEVDQDWKFCAYCSHPTDDKKRVGLRDD